MVDDMKQRMQDSRARFVKLVEKDRPEDLRYYCRHGFYVGHRQVFLYNCTEGCADEC